MTLETPVTFPEATGATAEIVVAWGADALRQQNRVTGSAGETVIVEWSVPLRNVPSDTVGITANGIFDTGDVATDQVTGIDVSGGGGGGIDGRTVALGAALLGVGYVAVTRLGGNGQ